MTAQQTKSVTPQAVQAVAKGDAAPLDSPPLTAQARRPVDHPDPGSQPGTVVPHPIDEKRQRITAQHRLFSDVARAVDLEDYGRARELLLAHDTEFSAEESWSDLREGYQLLVDCRQFPSASTAERGQRFVDEERGSTLRRTVRRACLESHRGPSRATEE